MGAEGTVVSRYDDHTVLVELSGSHGMDGLVRVPTASLEVIWTSPVGARAPRRRQEAHERAGRERYDAQPKDRATAEATRLEEGNSWYAEAMRGVLADPDAAPLSKKAAREVLAETLAADPEFASEWERAAIAREFSIDVLRFRVKHGLSQEQLAEELSVPVEVIAQLELGE